MAVRSGAEGVVKLLLEYDVDVFDGSFRIAIKEHNTNMINLLFTKYKHDQSQRDNLLAFAAKQGNIDIVKLFLDRGFNEEQALIDAIESHHEHIVNLLLERRTNPDVPSIQRKSAVCEAISCRNITIIKTLLRYGAHIHPESLKFIRWFGPKEIAALAEQFPVLAYTRRSMFPREESPRLFD